MYNKLFTKILDSSIWLEAMPTRLVWVTMIAAMDETGFVQFASVANLAHRAVVPLEDAARAVAVLEGADPNSSDPDNDGRRIERVPGGWIVLNAHKYREIVRRADALDKTRERVRRHRERNKSGPVTKCNDLVTTSEAVSGAVSEGGRERGQAAPAKPAPTPSNPLDLLRKTLRALALPSGTEAAQEWAAALQRRGGCKTVDEVLAAVRWVVASAIDQGSPVRYARDAATWIDAWDKSRKPASKSVVTG